MRLNGPAFALIIVLGHLVVLWLVISSAPRLGNRHVEPGLSTMRSAAPVAIQPPMP